MLQKRMVASAMLIKPPLCSQASGWKTENTSPLLINTKQQQNDIKKHTAATFSKTKPTMFEQQSYCCSWFLVLDFDLMLMLLMIMVVIDEEKDHAHHVSTYLMSAF